MAGTPGRQKLLRGGCSDARLLYCLLVQRRGGFGGVLFSEDTTSDHTRRSSEDFAVDWGMGAGRWSCRLSWLRIDG